MSFLGHKCVEDDEDIWGFSSDVDELEFRDLINTNRINDYYIYNNPNDSMNHLYLIVDEAVRYDAINYFNDLINYKGNK